MRTHYSGGPRIDEPLLRQVVLVQIVACSEGINTFTIFWVVASGRAYERGVYEVITFSIFNDTSHECVPGVVAGVEESDNVVIFGECDVRFCAGRCRGGVTGIAAFAARRIALRFLVLLFLSTFAGFVISLLAVGAFLRLLLVAPASVVARSFACLGEVSCRRTTRLVHPTFLVSEDL